MFFEAIEAADNGEATAANGACGEVLGRTGRAVLEIDGLVIDSRNLRT